MFRLTFLMCLIIAIALPVLAYGKKDSQIVIYEGLHIPIKFIETVDLTTLKQGDKIVIAVNEDAGVDELKVFKEDSEGVAFLTIKDGKLHIDSGKLPDIYGKTHPVDIKGFHLKDFEEGDKYIIPEGYVIDAFIKQKTVY